MSFDVDSIPSTEQLNVTLADRIYAPYKKQIWGGAVVFATVVVAVLGMRELDKRALDEQWTRYYEVRERELDGNTYTLDDKVADLRAISADFPDGAVVPHIDHQIAIQYFMEDRFAEAKQALENLQRDHPDFPVNGVITADLEGSTALSSALIEAADENESWQTETSYEHTWPSKERMLLLETNLGNLWLGFYDEAAARSEAIFEAAKRGEYNGTLVHEIRRRGSDERPQYVAVGAGGPDTWAEPRETIAPDPLDVAEPIGTRYTIDHVKRVVTSVETPTGESASRFRIVTADEGLPSANARTSVLGAIMEHGSALTVLDELARAPTYASNPETRAAPGILAVANHPYPYVYVRRASVWTNDGTVLEEGHTWDTSRTKSEAPEPFESDLPAQWKPEIPAEDRDDDGADEPDETGTPDEAADDSDDSDADEE